MPDQPDLDKLLDPQQSRRMDDPGSHAEPRQRSTAYDSQADVIGAREVHLLDYVRVLYKRRWTAATAFAVVFLSVVVYTFTATPIYNGRVRLLIEPENLNVVDFKEVLNEGQNRSDYNQTQYNLLQSRSLARRTLDTQKLWDHPLFGGRKEESFSVQRTIGGVISWASGLFNASDGKLQATADETTSQALAIDKLLSALTVSPVRNSRIVDLTFRSPDARLAAVVANAHARNYIEQNLEFKFMASKEATDWLGERLSEQRKKVEESELALQRYRERNDALALEDRQNIVVQKLTDLNAVVTRAKTERLEKEGLYNQLRAIQSDRAALDTFPGILSNAFIQQQKSELAALKRQQTELSEKLGERHPEMVKIASAIQTTEIRLQAEIAKVAESVRNQFLAARAQESSLVAALDAQKSDALSLNRKGIEYGVLQRDFESNRQIYESLLQRVKETGVSAELKTSNIRVVDAAELPESPVTPRKGLNLLLALLGGGVFATGLVFFFEYIDNRIKTPDEITANLGLPFLGMIPLIDVQPSGPLTPLLNNGVPANFAEAFRSVRTNVLFSSAEEGSRSIVITSTGPGEGKTLISCNLAVALAQAGLRVLLIDADLRRPQVHGAFAQELEPGLSNLMVGSAKAGDSLKKTLVPGLWTLTAGRIPPNPAELVGSRRFKEFLATMAQHFDWVVIDSPPVMAVTDVSLIAHSTSGVLFVVGAEMVSRHTARVAVEQLESASARIVGAVLNRVDLKHQAYYYSQYYRQEYTQYYAKSS